MGDLKKELTPRVYGIAFGNAKKAKLIRVDKGQIFRATESAKDETKESLQQLIDAGENNFEILDKNTIKSLKKRKLVTTKSIKSYAVTKGDKFSLNRKKKATVLTVEHMKKLMSEKDKEKNEERVWQTLDWRGANKNVFGQPVSGGYLHPLMKVRSEFRKVLLQMGLRRCPQINGSRVRSGISMPCFSLNFIPHAMRTTRSSSKIPPRHTAFPRTIFNA